MFPHKFGTVDQFVVKALLEIPSLPEHRRLVAIKNPEVLSLRESVLLIDIMRRKAAELNVVLENKDWTPRKIDMVLWSIGRLHEHVA